MTWIQPAAALLCIAGAIVLFALKEKDAAFTLLVAGGFATPSRNIGEPRT